VRNENLIAYEDAMPDQATAAQAVLDRLRNTSFGSPGYPTAYEVGQIGRTPGAQT
jgi:hypothetical protein